MRESDLEPPYSQARPRRRHSNGASRLRKVLGVLAFAALAIAEPIARLSSFLALICAASAGFFSLTGPENAPVTELLIGAFVLMLLPVLYYLLMRRMRPS